MSLSIDLLTINTIRTLAMDGVQKAKSGHPGMPMGAAAMAYTIWSRFLRHDPRRPDWANRDRFVLSGGHGSMLLYSLLHLHGYDLSLDDLKQFRQMGSKTPGHPEFGHTAGVETTTGPLGQGFSNGVGMAVAQKFLAATFNRPGFPLFDYTIYGICGDGDLMEGVASEAASLAAHLKLGNLIFLYDDNSISIDGSTDLSFTEDVAARFLAYGWHVQTVTDGNDVAQVETAINTAKAVTDKPSLIKVKTHIGYGSPNKQDTHEAHGSPLGEEEIRLTKKAYGWDENASFLVPEEVAAHCRGAIEKGSTLSAAWDALVQKYRAEHSDTASALNDLLNGSIGDAWKSAVPVFTAENGSIASREASGKVLAAITPHIPLMIGGSADLTPSNNTFVKGMENFSAKNYGGRYIRYGVREHGMGSVMNGIALTKGIVPYGGTFLIFSEYMRPPIRLASLMGIRPVYVFTHDSIGLGEDGPTHQPVEQIAALRAIPGITLLRPADANETAQAWKAALETTNGPVVLALTRQKLPFIDRTKYSGADGVAKGAYILAETSSTPDLILIGTGSELQYALGAYEHLAKEGKKVRLVSMPSWELFERQPKSYRDSVFPAAVTKRLAVEAGVEMGWHKYASRTITLNEFGKSAPFETLYKHFGLTTENVLAVAEEMLA